jgi:hypothetical protein
LVAIAALTPARAAAQLPTIQPPQVLATSRENFDAGIEVRELSDGRVLVNERTRRRLLILDAALSNPRVIFDAAARDQAPYPAGLVRLLPAAGDSTWFFDASNRTFRVIDPSGKVIRRQLSPAQDEVF